MAFAFCPYCGAPFEATTEPFAPQKCRRCGRTSYHNSSPCAGALILKNGRLLLVKRGIEPFKGKWDIPGGFLEPGEHPVQGVIREVKEETWLDVQIRQPLGVYIDRYEGPDGTLAFTLNHYFIVEPSSEIPQAADDAVDLNWFPLDALPGDSDIAFEHERDVLHDLVQWHQAQAKST